MVKTIWLIVSIVILLLIFLRVPKNNTGLSSFANKVIILGSSTQIQELLDYIIITLILIYFAFALYFNYNNMVYRL